MEKVELPIHKHPLLPITRFSFDYCYGCGIESNIYGGYRCNELECGVVFHRECAESLPEINHVSHPDHPLKLLESDKASHPDYPVKLSPGEEIATCCVCSKRFENGYVCSICNFRLHLSCAKEIGHILDNSNLHEHPLELIPLMGRKRCKKCKYLHFDGNLCYSCYQCDFIFHVECAEFFPEATHIFHPQHPLKQLKLSAAPYYVDDKCLLCGRGFGNSHLPQLHHYHCDVCNFSICKVCMKQPPPVRVESPGTHEHELYLVPRRMDFTCNACGTLGDRSPYFCLQCNFMIHRECIDLPRVININRHDHRISYTRRLGHGEERKCKVCRKKVDGFYGAYTCVKCPSFAVHSLCATRNDVWDMRELEGMPEEEEIAPFQVIDANTIKHFSHDHNLLRINKDGNERIQPESIVCEACLLQILSEPFYSCEQCSFILHEKCANHPRKRRHVSSNQAFTLLTDSRHEVNLCNICKQEFTGFRYESIDAILDVRCAAISDTLEHGSHQHPLYFDSTAARSLQQREDKSCSRCGGFEFVFRCDECVYKLDFRCATFPKKVMKNRYDDHPFFLSFGDMDVDGEYWCEACETKVNPKEWLYTCYDCGTILHISCVVGDYSYIMPGTRPNPYKNEQVVSNTSICRPLCSDCNSRCKLPSISKISSAEGDEYFCSSGCSCFHG